MDYDKKKAAVFILLGQSNALGHGTPMADEDKITEPLKNVYGLSRALNQSYDHDMLYWSGYTSNDMNLGEEQDDTYSVANCLAKLWQDEIDGGNKSGLPDLYIVHIAVGAQGVTEGYMWHPDRVKKMIPGKLGTIDIALYPFTVHILSLLSDSMEKLGKTPDVLGIHWRGGENDTTASDKMLTTTLKETYNRIFKGFYKALGKGVPTVLHQIVCNDRFLDIDPTGAYVKRMHYINKIFEKISSENDNITIFDVRKAPHYIPDIRGNGIFMKDAVHYTAETNYWVASEILNDYKKSIDNIR